MTYHYLVSDVDVPVMTDFPFGHLVAAANHIVNTKKLVWRPPNETPVKGQAILFEGLPFDILFEISKHLGYRGIIRLGATNRFFHNTLDPRKSLSAMEIAEFVQERDKADKNKFSDNFACYSCYRFRPRDKFPRNMIKAGLDRYCLDCAADMRWYGHMQCISNGKLLYHLCHNCGTWGTESTKCKGDKNTDQTLCTPKVTKQPSKLEDLPAHLLRIVTNFLGYRDVLRLTRTSRVMNEKIERDWVPMYDRFNCMNEKWARDRAGAPDCTDFDAMKEFPCFMCFKYKPRIKFTATQLGEAFHHPETSWKLRCQSCLQKMYSSQKHPLRKEWRRRRICRICHSLKHGGHTCGGCMELYVKGVIGRDTMFPRTTRTEFDYQDFLNELDGVFVEEAIEEPVDELVKHEQALDELTLGEQVEDIFSDAQEHICMKATRLVMGVGWFG